MDYPHSLPKKRKFKRKEMSVFLRCKCLLLEKAINVMPQGTRVGEGEIDSKGFLEKGFLHGSNVSGRNKLPRDRNLTFTGCSQ